MADREECRKSINGLVSKFINDIEGYTDPSYNETSVRNDFLNEFFTILGWDVSNSKGLPQHRREVRLEPNLRIIDGDGNTVKKPDYSFMLGSEIKFYVEAKKPAVNIFTNKDAVYQLRNYGWKAGLSVSILTNFCQFSVYDCKVPPRKDDDVSVARLKSCKIDDIDDLLDYFLLNFSRDSILNGNFDDAFTKYAERFEHQSFNDYFLILIKKWRELLSDDFLKSHPKANDETLNLSIQRIINRILFIRCCEDKGLEPHGTLKKVESSSDFEDLINSFDSRYDSGMFTYIKGLEFKISRNTLSTIISDVYYPNSLFDFEALDPFIIGQVYELFLSEQLHNENGTANVISKSVVKNSNGVFTTPRYIVDNIVSEIVPEKISAMSTADTPELRILDMSCGSGTFLISAFESVMNSTFESILKNGQTNCCLSSGRIQPIDGEGHYTPTFQEKRNILTNCIFGVDKDDMAVEVTKFSLLLKLLDGCTPDEIRSYKRTHKGRILPNLDSNIRVGNSLIDSNYSTFDSEILTDCELRNSIKPFDWNKEFKLKFDVIVGNPPYVSVQKMVKFNEREYEFIKSDSSGYVTGKAPTLDEYYLFVERALDLLSSDGCAGLLLSNRFMHVDSGKILRGLLSSKRSVKKIVDFQALQIFKDASNYVCLLFINKEENNSFEFHVVDDIEKFKVGTTRKETLPSSYLTENVWAFPPPGFLAMKDKMWKACKGSTIESACEFKVGLQTSMDDVYFVIPLKRENGLVSFLKNDVLYHVEESILRPAIHDLRLYRYHRIIPNECLIFPYKQLEGSIVPIPIDEMESSYPLALSYLRIFKEKLEGRNMNPKLPEWYAYGRSQGLYEFSGEDKLISGVVTMEPNWTFENSGILYTGGGNGPYYSLKMKPGAKESIFYIQAVMNYKFSEILLKNTASKFRGGYPSRGKKYSKEILLRRIDFDDPEDKSKHDAIVSYVQELMKLGNSMDEEVVPSRKKQIQSSMNELEKHVEDILNELYEHPESVGNQ